MRSIARTVGLIGLAASCIAVGCAPITRAYDLDEDQRNAITDSLEVQIGDPIDLTADLPEGYHLIESSVEVIDGWHGLAVAFEAEGPATHTLLPPKKLFLSLFTDSGKPGELFEPSFSDGIRNEKWRHFFWDHDTLACVRQLAGEMRVYKLSGTEFRLIGGRASVTETILGAWGNGTTITFIGSRWDEPGDMDLLGSRTQVFWMRQLCAGEWSPETIIRRQAEADVRMENIIALLTGPDCYALVTQEHRPGLVMGFDYDFIYYQAITEGQAHAPEAIGVYQSPAQLAAGPGLVVWTEPVRENGDDAMRLVGNQCAGGEWMGPRELARDYWPETSAPALVGGGHNLVVWRYTPDTVFAAYRRDDRLWGLPFAMPVPLGERYWLVTPKNAMLYWGNNNVSFLPSAFLTIHGGRLILQELKFDVPHVPIRSLRLGTDTKAASTIEARGNIPAPDEEAEN